MAHRAGNGSPGEDEQQVVTGKSLPRGGPDGLPHIVVDVCFLSQVVLVGFGLEQKLPGTGHLYALQSRSLIWIETQRLFTDGAEEGEGDGDRRLGRVYGTEPSRYGEFAPE